MRVSSIVVVGKVHCSLAPVFLAGPDLSDSNQPAPTNSSSVSKTRMNVFGV
jgi:hypothetical protein